MRKTNMIEVSLGLFAFLVSVTWMYFDLGFEPVICALSTLIVLVGSYSFKKEIEDSDSKTGKFSPFVKINIQNWMVFLTPFLVFAFGLFILVLFIVFPDYVFSTLKMPLVSVFFFLSIVFLFSQKILGHYSYLEGTLLLDISSWAGYEQYRKLKGTLNYYGDRSNILTVVTRLQLVSFWICQGEESLSSLFRTAYETAVDVDSIEDVYKHAKEMHGKKKYHLALLSYQRAIDLIEKPAIECRRKLSEVFWDCSKLIREICEDENLSKSICYQLIKQAKTLELRFKKINEKDDFSPLKPIVYCKVYKKQVPIEYNAAGEVIDICCEELRNQNRVCSIKFGKSGAIDCFFNILLEKLSIDNKRVRCELLRGTKSRSCNLVNISQERKASFADYFMVFIVVFISISLFFFFLQHFFNKKKTPEIKYIAHDFAEEYDPGLSIFLNLDLSQVGQYRFFKSFFELKYSKKLEGYESREENSEKGLSRPFNYYPYLLRTALFFSPIRILTFFDNTSTDEGVFNPTKGFSGSNVTFLYLGRGSNAVNYLYSLFMVPTRLPDIEGGKMFIPKTEQEFISGIFENCVVYSHSDKMVRSGLGLAFKSISSESKADSRGIPLKGRFINDNVFLSARVDFSKSGGIVRKKLLESYTKDNIEDLKNLLKIIDLCREIDIQIFLLPNKAVEGFADFNLRDGVKMEEISSSIKDVVDDALGSRFKSFLDDTSGGIRVEFYCEEFDRLVANISQ